MQICLFGFQKAGSIIRNFEDKLFGSIMNAPDVKLWVPRGVRIYSIHTKKNWEAKPQTLYGKFEIWPP